MSREGSEHTLQPYGYRERFRAYRNAAFNFSGGVDVLQCDVENYDTEGEYDLAPNYYFTPKVDGYYYIKASVGFVGQAVNNILHRLTIRRVLGANLVTANYTESGTATDQSFAVSIIARLLHAENYQVEIGTGAVRVGIANDTRTFFEALRVGSRDW